MINSFPHLEELRAPGDPEAGHKPGHLGTSLCNLTDSRRMVLTQEHLSRVTSSRWQPLLTGLHAIIGPQLNILKIETVHLM